MLGGQEGVTLPPGEVNCYTIMSVSQKAASKLDIQSSSRPGVGLKALQSWEDGSTFRAGEGVPARLLMQLQVAGGAKLLATDVAGMILDSVNFCVVLLQ